MPCMCFANVNVQSQSASWKQDGDLACHAICIQPQANTFLLCESTSVNGNGMSMSNGAHLLQKGLSGAGMEAKRCVVICI